MLTLRDGLVVPLERVRTTSKAVARLEALAVEACRACVDGFDIGVQHLANESTAHAVAERLGTTLDHGPVPVDEVGAAIGAHVGPGMVSVSVTPRE